MRNASLLLLFVLVMGFGIRYSKPFLDSSPLDDAPASGKDLPDAALIDALSRGGYVIVMRHASAPFELPEAESADIRNVFRERQLDDLGKESAIAMGEALRQLSIPIGEVLSSPLYRAMQTVELLGIANVEYIPDLAEVVSDPTIGIDTPGLQGERSAWLSAKAAESPPVGTNRLIVTHFPNLQGAFSSISAVLEGESLIIRSDGGKAVVIARLKIEAWPTFISD